MSVVPLTSITTVREQLRLSSAEASDQQIQFKIDMYSKAIAAYCHREFGEHPTDGLQRTFGYTGRGYLSLDPYDLRSIVTVTFDVGPGGTPTVLTNLEYNLPDPGPDGTYWSLRGLPSRTGRVLITIAGNWGTLEIPEDVEGACVMAVGDGLRNPEGFASRSIGELSYTEVAEEATVGGRNLPADARAMLGPYRRHVYA